MALYGGPKDGFYDSMNAYWEMFCGANENVGGNPYNSRQQASFDLFNFDNYNVVVRSSKLLHP